MSSFKLFQNQIVTLCRTRDISDFEQLLQHIIDALPLYAVSSSISFPGNSHLQAAINTDEYQFADEIQENSKSTVFIGNQCSVAAGSTQGIRVKINCILKPDASNEQAELLLSLIVEQVKSELLKRAFMEKELDYNRLVLFSDHLYQLLFQESEDLFSNKIQDLLFGSAAFLNASSAVIHFKVGDLVLSFTYGFTDDVIQYFVNMWESKQLDNLSEKTISQIIYNNEQEAGFILFSEKEGRHGSLAYNETDKKMVSIIANYLSAILSNRSFVADLQKMVSLNNTILEAVNAGIIATDENLNILRSNAKARQYLNINSEAKSLLLDAIPKGSPLAHFINDANTKKEKNYAQNLPYSAATPRLYNAYYSPIATEYGSEEVGSIIALEDVTEMQTIQSSFTKYVSKELLDEILAGNYNQRLGGEKMECAILFSDIRGFTAISEKLGAEEIVETLNQYYNMMLSCITENKGYIDKLVGDEIMAIFNHDEGLLHPAERAASSAILMRERLLDFNQKRTEFGKQTLYFGTGINYGEVIRGNIGSYEKMDFTVIGDSVNVAAKICSVAKKNQIYITREVAQNLTSRIPYEPDKTVFIKGKTDGITVFTI